MSIITKKSKAYNSDRINFTGGTLAVDGRIEINNLTPPTGNYTSHFGPLIQGVAFEYEGRTSYSLTSGSTRNGSTVYLQDMNEVSVSIDKKYPNSKIVIAGLISGEFNNANEYNFMLAIKRLDADGVFEEEVGTPSSAPSLVGIGLTQGHYQDTDQSTTMQWWSFNVVDGNATSVGTYTYVPIAIGSVTGTFYLNRTVTNTAGPFAEQVTSWMIVKEVF